MGVKRVVEEAKKRAALEEGADMNTMAIMAAARKPEVRALMAQVRADVYLEMAEALAPYTG